LKPEEKINVESEFQKEMQLGLMYGPLPERHTALFYFYKISPSFFIPKGDGDLRRIEHMSYLPGNSVNNGIDVSDMSVHYATVQQMMVLLQKQKRGVYMSKCDIKDAYRNVLVHPSDWPLLCIYDSEGSVVFSNRFPMGGRPIPFQFDILTELVDFAKQHNITPISELCLSLPPQYRVEGMKLALEKKHGGDMQELESLSILDDFLDIHCQFSTTDGHVAYLLAVLQMKSVHAIFHALGWLLKKEKSVIAETNLIFLGVGWDSEEKACYIPKGKSEKYLKKVEEVIVEKRGFLSLKEWRTLLGILVWVCFLVFQARARLYYLFQCLKAGERRLREIAANDRRRGPASIMIRMSAEAKHDLHWWLAVLKDPPFIVPCYKQMLKMKHGW
jgi:hypothetical protein